MADKSPDLLFDVVATNLETRARRVLARGMNRETADVFIHYTYTRSGVDQEFYSKALAGSVRDPS